MKNKFLLIHINLFILLFSSVLFAQEQKEQTEAPVWKDTIGLSVGAQYLSHTNELLTWNYGFKYSSNFQDVWNLNININGAYGKSEGKVIQNEHKLELTVDRWLYKVPLSITSVGNIETNETSYIYSRSIAGVGLKLKPFDNRWIMLALSMEPVVEYTRPLDMSQELVYIKLQSGINFVFNFTEDKSRTFTFNFKHLLNLEDSFMNVKDVKDYRIETNYILSLALFKNLRFETTFKYEYTRIPLGGNSPDLEKPIPKSSYSLISSLSFEFGN